MAEKQAHFPGLRNGLSLRSLDLPRLLVLFGASILVIIWGAIAFEIDRDRANALAEWTRNLENLTRAFEEHTERTVSNVDQVVKFVRGQYLEHGERTDLPGLVKQGAIASLIFNQVGVIDAKGMYILSSLPLKTMFLGDRDHFKFHANGQGDVPYISKPVLGRASGRWSIQLTRPIVGPDGRFGGVVVASLDPEYFGSLYSDVNLGPAAVITLAGSDGTTLARRSNGKFTLGQNISSAPLFNQFKASAAGHYIERSRVDGALRLYAFRRLPDYPLAVVTGVTLAHVYGRSDERRDGLLQIGAVATAIIMLFAGVILRLLRRQAKTLADLERSRSQAESANKMKSVFLASMSHELRTPLNGILGFADLLRHVSPDEKSRRYGETIHASGSHLLAVLNSILDIAKIEAGRMEIHLREEELRPLIETTVQIHQIAAAAKGLRLELDAAANLPEQLLCDGTLLRQVLNNLLNNAIKFTQRGHVAILVCREGGGGHPMLRFSVRDTGIGIPPQGLSLIFEKFRQIDQSANRAHEGTGLGLALAKNLVELMGGEISVESALGEGTTISFTLPLEPGGRVQPVRSLTLTGSLKTLQPS